MASGYKGLPPMTPQERCRDKVDAYNKTVGAPRQDGVDCPLCKNKGFIAQAVQDGNMWYDQVRRCDCQMQRMNLQRMRDSGLEGILQRYTFDNWRPDTELAMHMLMTASKFATVDGAWLFVGGQSGSGKTHMCTAVCGQLLKMGASVHYMLWRDEIARLKAQVGKDEEYARHMDKLKRCDVLYIDDLFKTGKAADSKIFSPTAADINAAFEIINYRYNDPRKRIIISTEILLPDLTTIDEAIAGRIKERCGEFTINIGYDKAKNRRMQ